MSRKNEIVAGFDVLREFCDPRGHGVLDALEQLCIVEAAALDAVLEAAAPEPSNVVRMIEHYSRKVGA